MARLKGLTKHGTKWKIGMQFTVAHNDGPVTAPYFIIYCEYELILLLHNIMPIICCMLRGETFVSHICTQISRMEKDRNTFRFSPSLHSSPQPWKEWLKLTGELGRRTSAAHYLQVHSLVVLPSFGEAASQPFTTW